MRNVVVFGDIKSFEHSTTYNSFFFWKRMVYNSAWRPCTLESRVIFSIFLFRLLPFRTTYLQNTCFFFGGSLSKFFIFFLQHGCYWLGWQLFPVWSTQFIFLSVTTFILVFGAVSMTDTTVVVGRFWKPFEVSYGERV